MPLGSAPKRGKGRCIVPFPTQHKKVCVVKCHPIETQIQLPDYLYEEVIRVAKEREMSLAEVMRQGIEYMSNTYPPLSHTADCPPLNPGTSATVCYQLKHGVI